MATGPLGMFRDACDSLDIPAYRAAHALGGVRVMHDRIMGGESALDLADEAADLLA